MIEVISSRFDLIANIVICALFFAVGFFISTVMAEKRHFKSEEKHLQAELKVAHVAGRAPEDLAEIERLRDELNRQTAELKQKTELLHQRENELTGLKSATPRSPEDVAEIERLHGEIASQLESMKVKDLELGKMIEQVNILSAERQQLEARMTENSGETGELGRLRSEMSAKAEETAARERELAKLREEHEVNATRIGQAEKIVSDYEKFEKTITDQRRSAHDVEQRIREMKIKLRVLSEKAKENVEIIAAFAGAPEFDQFRKSIHLDEANQKYEDEIKDIHSKEQ